jgi:HEAT repeat protein
MSDRTEHTGEEPQLGGVRRETPPESSGQEPGIGGERAVDFLVEGLQSSDPIIYQRALFQLAKRNNPQAIDRLIEILLWDGFPLERFTLRVQAANALARMEHDRAIEALIDALQHPNWGIQIAAAGSLGLTGDSRAVGPLIELMKGRANSWAGLQRDHWSELGHRTPSKL